ncbi:SpoIID/LytB domain-containing protein [Salibacter sp.]|uniref:SpoIID/LytB domain-containing protein n=1 Tax=Salibacter sp. TaxID=2010995 RepID=UPI0028704069|nr:SpoIID/LytB domain-containing protein [Salibacter sp.]MDR9399033.1 SpoIID/LytB domain-containing protein [Salibacter sp.]MDR9487301.1 SpoIID/LytB domain-containing protein [Salibacter sp.]
MRILVFISLLFWVTQGAFSQHSDRVRVGLFWNERPASVIVRPDAGAYQVYGDGKLVTTLHGMGLFQISIQSGLIEVKNFSKSYGRFKQVKLVERDPFSRFKIKPVSSDQTQRIYEDDLEISIYKNRLKIINEATMANYVAGVVQSESGNGHEPEFYKVQSIISRTYALKHFDKYEKIGFNLCDRVNSQVYKTYGYNDTIKQAVKETRDIVMVDAEINLVTAAFHSNSGGETINSEDTWTYPRPYLKSVEDTFSLCMPHFEWEKTISRKEYLTYLHDFKGVDTTSYSIKRYLLNYCPEQRQSHLFQKDSIIALDDLRRHFELKSTHFCVDTQNDSILIVGKGFGHGVGLSQEGAMKMAKLGYNYSDILHHYYSNIHLIKLSVIDFFKAEN